MPETLEMTAEAFAAVVKERAKRKPYVLALYETLDEYQSFEYQKRSDKPACHRTCSMCCYQIVTVFGKEMEEIRDYIERLPAPVRKRLRGRIRQAVEEWRMYLTGQALSKMAVDNPIKLSNDWFGKPCPFLQDDGSCGVYEVRPLVCRTTTSAVRCTELVHIEDGRHCAQMRYDCERWANDLLFKYVTAHGENIVTPLHYFLANKYIKV